MAKEGIVLLGCGDVGPIHGPVEPYSTLVRSTLATGDIRFSQCERVYSVPVLIDKQLRPEVLHGGDPMLR